METGVRVYMDTMTIPLVPLPEIVSVSGYGSMADTDSLSTTASGDTGEKEFKARVNNEILKECGSFWPGNGKYKAVSFCLLTVCQV